MASTGIWSAWMLNSVPSVYLQRCHLGASDPSVLNEARHLLDFYVSKSLDIAPEMRLPGVKLHRVNARF